MNKLTKQYVVVTLGDGTVVELKYAQGAIELFARKTGLNTIAEVNARLLPEAVQLLLAEGSVANVPFSTLSDWRLFVLCAAQYVALVQNKPADFTEWQVQEWIDEVGLDKMLFNPLFSLLSDSADPDDSVAKEGEEGEKKTNG